MSKEEITKDLEKVWNDPNNKELANPQRKIHLNTGKAGAILWAAQFDIGMRESIAGAKLSEEVKEAILAKHQANADDWEEGIYSVTEQGLKYHGLRNDEMQDGIQALKRNGKLYIEKWKTGFREDYKILTIKEFKEMMVKAGKEIPEGYFDDLNPTLYGDEEE